MLGGIYIFTAHIYTSNVAYLPLAVGCCSDLPFLAEAGPPLLTGSPGSVGYTGLDEEDCISYTHFVTTSQPVTILVLGDMRLFLVLCAFS